MRTSTATLTTAYTYDPANRIASITYPSGAAVVYTRDTMGRVASVSAQPSGGASTLVASSIAYKPFGPDAGLRYGSAGQQTRSFDQDYRLTNVTDIGTVRRGLGRVAENLSYAYYPTNNVQAITDAVTSANSQSFSYDNLQRLSNASGGYGGFGFTYDGDGNRLSQTLGTTTTNYGYGSGSDLLATISVGGVQTQAIGYTADGRMASLSPGIQAPDGQYITSLGYNQDARLSALNAAGGALASYTYDGFGQRVAKTISGTTGNLYQYGQDGLLLEETNTSGTAQADYIYLAGRPVAVLNGSTLYYLHDDMLGTPQLATDSNQAVQWQATYQPFGTASASGTVTQNLRFPGQYFDAESGWNHNGFRNYAPTLGRYIEPDPLGRLGSGNNLYAYVGNNPINNIDPLGLTMVTSPAWFPGASGPNSRGDYTMNVNDGSDATTVLKMVTQDQLHHEEQLTADRLHNFEKTCGKNRKHESYFDTRFFKGVGKDRDYYYVQGMDRIYADNEINYLGIGMYERWLGDSLTEAQAITLAWKETQYPGRTIPSGTWYWLQRGYDDYPNMGSGSSSSSSGSSGGRR